MAYNYNKNISPKQLSGITAIGISIVVLITSLLLSLSKLQIVILYFASLVSAYFIINTVLQFFIYRKIKLVYKLIYDTKSTKKEALFDDTKLLKKSIDEVHNDVEKWATTYLSKIDVLEKNEQFRKEFLMNLAHELRTPIFTSKSYIDTVISEDVLENGDHKRFLINASNALERLSNLADHLNEISQLESGKSNIKFEDFIIQDLIKDIFNELEVKALEKNITFSFKEGTQLPLTVFADEAKIKQVVYNLIFNGIKYGKQNGFIKVGIYAMDQDRAFVEISDNGIGIPQTEISRVFERFYRADKSRNSNIGGTGLGLAIVKHIIEAHHQTINVRSKIDVGSSFGFTLATKKPNKVSAN
ncbi:MAG TPA: ATP-binding protein [Chitinophagaceae bacterium]|nr:ATP-binding protein [Chitinophagaceae bacterium]